MYSVQKTNRCKPLINCKDTNAKRNEKIHSGKIRVPQVKLYVKRKKPRQR